MRVRRSAIKRLVCTLLLAAAVAPPVIAGTWTAMLAHWGPPDASDACEVLSFDSMRISDASIPTPRKNESIVDDAARRCGCDVFALVELRVATDGVTYIGHAFLHTPRRTIGFRTAEDDISAFDFVNPFARSLPGFVRDDTVHEYDRIMVYRACPATVTALESAIDENAAAPYQIGGWDGGLNCATWATHCLRAAGLSPPPGSFPNQLARHMLPVASNARPVDADRGHGQ